MIISIYKKQNPNRKGRKEISQSSQRKNHSVVIRQRPTVTKSTKYKRAHEHKNTRAHEACIRAEPRKPAKEKADVMQEVKERPTEAPFTTMQSHGLRLRT